MVFYDGSLGIVKELERKIREIGLQESKQIIVFEDSSNNSLKEERFYNCLEK